MDIGSTLGWLGSHWEGAGDTRRSRIGTLTSEVLSNPKSRLVVRTGSEGQRKEKGIRVLKKIVTVIFLPWAGLAEKCWVWPVNWVGAQLGHISELGLRLCLKDHPGRFSLSLRIKSKFSVPLTYLDNTISSTPNLTETCFLKGWLEMLIRVMVLLGSGWRALPPESEKLGCLWRKAPTLGC